MPHTKTASADESMRRKLPITHFVPKECGGDPSRSPPFPYRSEQSKLFLHCVVKLPVGVHHVLMRLLDVIELLLLFSREQRTDL